MKLEDLAEHPAAPPVLIGALVDYVTSQNTQHPFLLAALLQHPNTTTAQVNALLTVLKPPGHTEHRWGGLTLWAAISRNPLPEAVLKELATPTLQPRILTLLNNHTHNRGRAVPGLVDRMVQIAVDHPATRHTLIPAILYHPDTTANHREQLITALVTNPDPLPAARTWIGSLLVRHGPDAAWTLAQKLAPHCHDPWIRSDLNARITHDDDRARVHTLLIDGAHASNDPALWEVTLRTVPDPDGTFTRSILDRNDLPGGTLLHLAARRDIPTQLRVQAYLRERHQTDPDAVPATLGHDLFPHLTPPLTEAETVYALEHPDLPLTADQITDLWNSTTHDLELAEQVAQQPHTPRPIRQRAIELLGEHRPTGLVLPYAQVLLTYPLGDFAQHLPTRSYSTTTCPRPLVPLVSDQLGDLLVMITTTEQAGVLLELTPDFNGTIGELFTTATTTGARGT